MRGYNLVVNVSCAEYEGRTEPAWIRGTIETPWLDVSAAVSEDNWVSLAVVNVHESQGFKVQLQGVISTDVDVYTVSGSSTSVVNIDGKQEVGIKESKWDGNGLFLFPKHSFTILRWKA
jgi:alpha-N-arabinofuranosidase